MTFRLLVKLIFILTLTFPYSSYSEESFAAVLDMDMMILPGTQSYLEKSIDKGQKEGAKLVVVKLNTPGGVLSTTQSMMQKIINSEIPIIIYVSPSGGTATSAGVFITMAGHIAAMAPGTSIGAAHPVAGDGKDIEGDMREKAENMATAMVRSISTERGRNVEWVEKSVRESSSITANEALKKNVIEIVATDVKDLLSQLKGKEIKLKDKKFTFPDYSNLIVKDYSIGTRDKVINVLANPNVAALLWMGATTGISLELYNPGSIFPGVVGVICLLLALAVSQIIPISHSGILLLVTGALLIGADMFVGSGVLAIGGIVALAFGAVYLIDVTQAPGLEINPEFIIPVAIFLGLLALFVSRTVYKALREEPKTAKEGLVGQTGKVLKNIAKEGKVLVAGEYWKAVPAKSVEGIIDKGSRIRVVSIKEGMVLEVEKI